ncbi:hypothetical protein CYLTODRAFT_408517 [Cylindrobasidium torrendii FP15055 ss-10]|uniref:Uncharacterized protein n=1 Tax=Cylindrobasidium torrendii FP15055 ss-10 TaxID=1314674 RepID=A0A0D7BMR6_9AGAR|nr:hypothetical protein CYLTODRAFT_408517 [Cylindrobasidium torrendii FP15055 ss-10]
MGSMDAAQQLVYKNILLKSTAMSGITVAPSTSAPKSPLNNVIQAIATLLTVTTPSDPTAANVVAATCIVDPNSVSINITARNVNAPVKLDRETIAARAQDRKAFWELATNSKHVSHV